MKNKPKILIFIDWFYPGYKGGGPIKSVSNIVNSLQNEFDFYIITSDRDLNDKHSYTNIPFNQWISNPNYTIAYLSRKERKRFISIALAEHNYSKIYFNSLYSKNYTLQPILLIKKLKLSIPIIVAPRGMLGKGALKIKSVKKKLFLTIVKVFSFFKNIIWHATDKKEQESILSIFGNDSTVITIPNISAPNIEKKEIKKNKNELKLIFFSRISSKKNLFYALEIINQLKLDNLSLSIYGTLEDKLYWNKCKTYIESNKLNVQYLGELNPTSVVSTLSEYHFLFFPTLHENYGHVIVEALTSGCGLILSKNTPWRKLNSVNIGWDIDLSNSNKFAKAIELCYKMSQNDYNQIRNNCYHFIINEINKQNAKGLTKDMFLQ